MILCVDAGATHTRTALWDGERLGDYRRHDTPRPGHYDGATPPPAERQRLWVQFLTALVAARRRNAPIDRVAVSFPGLVSADGTMFRAASVWGAAPSDLPAATLAASFGLPVTVVNDMSAATARYGANPRFADVGYLMLLTVSTGIGSKLYDVRERKVVLEPKGRNGELGLVVVDRSPEALRNDNGNFAGILGNYSSGTGAMRLVARAAVARPDDYAGSQLRARVGVEAAALAGLDRVRLAEAVVACVRAGDPFCRAVIAESIGYLATVLHTIVLFAGPEVIILTGGFAEAIGDHYRETLARELGRRFTFAYEPDEIDRMIRFGARDDLDNLIGAGQLASLDRECRRARVGNL